MMFDPRMGGDDMMMGRLAVYDQAAQNARMQMMQQLQGMGGIPQMSEGFQAGPTPQDMASNIAEMKRQQMMMRDPQAMENLRMQQAKMPGNQDAFSNMPVGDPQQQLMAKRQQMMQRVPSFGSRPMRPEGPASSPMQAPMTQNRMAQNRQRMMTARRPQGPGSRMVY